MKVYRALFLCYVAAVAISTVAAQPGNNNGNDNGVYDLGERHAALSPHGQSMRFGSLSDIERISLQMF